MNTIHLVKAIITSRCGISIPLVHLDGLLNAKQFGMAGRHAQENGRLVSIASSPL